MTQAIRFRRFTDDELGQLSRREKAQKQFPLLVRRGQFTPILRLPPAQICLADLDELRLGTDFRGGRSIQREIDRIERVDCSRS